MNIRKILKQFRIVLLFSVPIILGIGIKPVKGEEVEPLEPVVGSEVIERRTANSRHFYLGGGRYQAEIYAEPIHVLDQQGNWQPFEPAVPDSTTINGSVELPFSSTDTYISTGDSTPMGGQSILWIGRENPTRVYRTLVNRSSFSDLPPYAMIDDGSSDVVIKLYLDNAWNGTTGWGSGNDVYVAIYEMTNIWGETYATWFDRFTSAPWNTPGGDYNGGILNALSITEVGDTWGYHSWSHFVLRDVMSLWKTYLSEPNFGQHGRLPYGLLFELLYESDTGIQDVKQFLAEEHTGTAMDPKLVINYSDGPVALTNTSPVHRRVPSPDYYSIPAFHLWQVVAVRVEDSDIANYDLELYSSDAYTSRLAKSDYPADNVDLIAIDQLVTDQVYYPFVYSENGGVGYYRIEYQQRLQYWSGSLDPGRTAGPYIMENEDVVHSFSFMGTSVPCIHINPSSGNARLGAAIFESGGSTGRFYSRDQALTQDVASSNGESLKLCPHLTQSGVHALVIWNEASTMDTTYMVEIGDYERYLPLISR